MEKITYLDYAATTPLDKDVVNRMIEVLQDDTLFANPSSATHDLGVKAHQHITQARAEIAAFINATPQEIIFTSGATEANNLALFGIAKAFKNKPCHIISVKTEHKSVLDALQVLENDGVEITLLEPDAKGQITSSQLAAAIRPHTMLISIMLVNNETGVHHDIAALAELALQNKILFHCDAVQALGKIPVDVKTLNVDLMSISAHKIYGPKGIGALYVREGIKRRLRPHMVGGGQEQGLRSGTLPIHQIVGFAAACQKAAIRLENDRVHIQSLFEHFTKAILSIADVSINGPEHNRVPHIVNLTIGNVRGDALIFALKHFAISQGSACNSREQESSHVLRAMGLTDEASARTIRVSFGRTTTKSEVDAFISAFKNAVTRLRALSIRDTTLESQLTIQAQAGSKSLGNWVTLGARLENEKLMFYYRMYGGPYLIAGCEWLATVLSEATLLFLIDFDIDKIETILNAPPQAQAEIAILKEAMTHLSWQAKAYVKRYAH